MPENVKESGAAGVLINHSEDRLNLKEIKKTIKRAKDAGLITVICAPTPQVVQKVVKFNPTFVAIEPPELIGGDVSVSKAKPGVILNSVKKTGKIPLLCGAGVKTTEDVKLAITYGSMGILLASGVTKAKNPEKALMNLAKGL